MLTFPTLAYEYDLPALLGFVPLFIYWAKPLTIPNQYTRS